MPELDQSRQKAIAEIVRRWSGTEILRRHLRKLLNWQVEPELPPTLLHWPMNLMKKRPDAQPEDTQR
ncbi:hypothetical protein NKI20_12105 [Mesorhizobium sp. M0830]|uniref:hypothetical protein n=1 Tax=Mesorhizobium sp. M0830 TaxID=2957008 RepID=UPI003337FDC8